jgi:acetyl-CoA carboxylase biotin carboxyl carrier protein
MTEVRAEIAANVWKVTTEVGEAVTVGQTLAVLESMKMEIPVESPVDGTVTAVHVAPEDRVAEGDVIATIS